METKTDNKDIVITLAEVIDVLHAWQEECEASMEDARFDGAFICAHNCQCSIDDADYLVERFQNIYNP